MLAVARYSACGTFVSHTDASLPEAEQVILQCDWRHYFVSIMECHVSAVDGRRPGALQFAKLTTELAPGHCCTA
jgi:hypothetical protein